MREQLPRHYQGSDKDVDRPTPGIEATECADQAVRGDMERINEHWRRRGKRPPPRK